MEKYRNTLGVGCKRNLPIFLHDGDLVEVEIEEIGMLKRPVLSNA